MRILFLTSLLLLHSPLALATDQYDGLTAEQKSQYLETCIAPPPSKGSGLYATDRTLCWDPGDELTVQFLDGSTQAKDFVMTTVKEWSSCANIKFRRVETAGQIRVTFRARGFRSVIGRDALTKAQTKATMDLGFASDNPDSWKRHVLHEFGHALGFAHEHQSPAAHIQWNDEAMKFYLSLGPPWTEQKIRENIFNPIPPKKSGTWTEFDPLSIMLYPVSPRHTVNHVGFGWNKELSVLDKKKAAELYKW